MADRPIKVALLEGDFAVLSLLGFPLGLTIQLQQSNLNLADALWTAKSSKSGFSVSFYWPAQVTTSKTKRKRKSHPTITFTEINGSGCIPQYLIRWFSIFCFSCLLLSAFWRQGFLKNNYISKYNTQYLTFDSLYSCTFLRFLGLWRLGSWFIGLLRFLALWVLGS